MWKKVRTSLWQMTIGKDEPESSGRMENSFSLGNLIIKKIFLQRVNLNLERKLFHYRKGSSGFCYKNKESLHLSAYLSLHP